MLNFKSWTIFVLILFITIRGKPISASTHWVVTENGRIQSQLDSAFHMQRPYDLISLLEQEKRAQKIENLYKEMLGRKAAIDVEWASLESATDLEVKLYGTDKDCLKAGKPLTDLDLYSSISDDGFGREGILLNEMLPFELSDKSTDLPDCKAFMDLDFSMDTFPHIQALSWNLSSSSEFLESKFLSELSPHLITAGLRKNKTSWFLYNLAAIYWRTQGNAHKALECSKRAIHFAPRQYRDLGLLNLGCLLQQARYPAEAAILLHAAVDHAPKQPIAHFALANVYAILGDYNRSIACYDNALSLKPRWAAAERNRFAVLCHRKLEGSLYQLHRSLQGILTQLHNYHERQEHWLKHQEELLYQQAPLHMKLQNYQHESLTAMLNHRDKCIPIVQDGTTILNCDQLLAHHLQIDITLSLQLLLKNVESQAQKISEQMSHRLSGISLNNQIQNKLELLKVSEENVEGESNGANGLEIFIDGSEGHTLRIERNDNASLEKVLEEVNDKLNDNVMGIVEDFVQKQRVGYFKTFKFREMNFLQNQEESCQTFHNKYTDKCPDHNLEWTWNHDELENQLFTMMGMSKNEKCFENKCFQMRCQILSFLIVTWFQFEEWELRKSNMLSNETPKCIGVTEPLSDLSSYAYGEIKPEPRLLPLLAALLDDENISASDVALRISYALKIVKKRTIATAAVLYWRYIGDVDQMLSCLQYAVDVASPNSKFSPLVNVGHILLTLGHHKEALLLATLALQVSPQSVFAHSELFHIYKDMGDKIKAIQYGRSAASLQEELKAMEI
uniref:Tetratricopeptide repeat protein 17 n=1 Tax=Clastoptera arizonana TaxID=38151 RepID=A0A1B6E4T7_9HEMI